MDYPNYGGYEAEYGMNLKDTLIENQDAIIKVQTSTIEVQDKQIRLYKALEESNMTIIASLRIQILALTTAVGESRR
jgi:hypothetical protein